MERDFRQTARTREQSVQTAKFLYQLADAAIRVSVDESLAEQEQGEAQDEGEDIALAVC